MTNDYFAYDSGVGIDVGKEELMVCVTKNGTSNQTALFPNSSIGQKRLVGYIRKNKIDSSVPILLESTGPYHWKTAQTLREQGFLTKVANPLHTKQMARYSIRKVKTDKVDSERLALLAMRGCGYVFIETEEQAKNKAISRHYFKLRALLTQMNQHESYLKDYRSIKNLKLSFKIEKELVKVKKELIASCSKGNDLKYLVSIPGIGLLLGSAILCEIRPVDRFRKMSQIVAFAGLDPSVKQSGGKPATHGRLSKRGSNVLRKSLYLAAFVASRQPPFNQLYSDYKQRGLCHKEIICILARKLLRISVALLRKRRVFNHKTASNQGHIKYALRSFHPVPEQIESSVFAETTKNPGN